MLPSLLLLLALLLQLGHSRPQEDLPQDCSCNGVLKQKKDGSMKGQCQTEREGAKFCYVTKGGCEDAQQNIAGDGFWSHRACRGVKEEELVSLLEQGAELRQVDDTHQDCSCNGVLKHKKDGSIKGQCQTEREGAKFCYVDKGGCGDEQENIAGDGFWSHRACWGVQEEELVSLLDQGAVEGAGLGRGALWGRGASCCT